MWDFAKSNPGTALLMVLIVSIAVCSVVHSVAGSWRVWVRSRNISRHGWPVPPVDADGDVVPAITADAAFVPWALEGIRQMLRA